MGVQEITGSAQFNAAVQSPQLVVVDFFATWCGPCRNIAPFVEQLSTIYTDVTFLKVDADRNGDLIQQCGVSAFPTFQFFVNGSKVDEMKGANSSGLESKVNQWKPSAGASFGGKGQTLGSTGNTVVWDGVGDPPGHENARAARLKAFGHLDAKKKNPNDVRLPSPPTETATATRKNSENDTTQLDEDEAIARAIALSMAPQNLKGETYKEQEKEQEKCVISEDWDGDEMVPVPVDDNLLAQLVAMEIPDVRARKGLVHGQTVEGALSWLEDNQASPDIDQPYMVKKKDAVPKKPLTAEEKSAKLQELKEKAARRKKEREEKEKMDTLQREKERRVRGQQLSETEEERNRLQRKREAARKKKEKEDIAKERARLRAEIARDKELRKANNGVIPSVLGVDGYNPSSVQYDKKEVSLSTTLSEPAVGAVPEVTTSSTTSVPKKINASSRRNETSVSDPVAVIDTALNTICRYRTGGDGGQALKLLRLLLHNVATHPGEDGAKYRSINLEGKAYKGKLASLVGPSALLKAVGFRLNDSEDKFVLPEGEETKELISETIEKIARAEELYLQMTS